MKIVKNTKDQMVVEDRPYVTGFGLIAFSLYWLWVAIGTLLDGNVAGVLPLAVFGATLFAFTIFVRLKLIELYAPSTSHWEFLGLLFDRFSPLVGTRTSGSPGRAHVF